MTTQLRTREPPVPSPPATDRATTPLAPAAEFVLDALPLLDHRTRSRTIDPVRARRGHYLVMSDGAVERLLGIDDRIMHLGRSLGADVRFEDVQISRRHAIIVRYGHHVRVLDDRSANGTFVNGARIIAIDLVDGDVIRLGNVALRYVRLR
jgi:pSer/pThr/pTyr-binding forkhead associated (FHA) protein